MQTTTKAIVLHLTKHKDNASILHTYTQQYGRTNFLVYGIGKKNSKTPTALLTPLNIVELTFNYQPSKDIQILKEITFNSKQYTDTDIASTAIKIFLSEILYLTLVHPMPEEDLFCFIENTIKDIHQADNPNIHLFFLCKYIQYLGIYPNIDENEFDYPYFNIPTAEFTPIAKDLNICFSKEEIALLKLIENNTTQPQLSRKKRQTILRKICLYLEYNLESFRSPKSLDILEEVFDE